MSTRIGRDASEYLINKGWMVFGSIRNLVDGQNLIQKYKKIIPLEFDVTDELTI